MVPVQFNYEAPKSLDEAVALLHQNEEAYVLAGGHDLLPQMKLRNISPRLLVDLQYIPDLRGIRHSDGEDSLYIGAMVTCNEFVNHAAVQSHCEALVEAANSIGDAQVRNCTTLGGNLAGGDPAADLSAAILVLEAELHVVGPNGPREIAADQFFVGPFDTALEPGEVIKELRFPMISEQTTGTSTYEKIKNPANSYPICGVAAALTLIDNKSVSKCRVAVTGATAHPVRLHDVEAALEGTNVSAMKIEAAVKQANNGLNCVSNLFASGEYRANLVTVLTERALTRAIEQTRQR